ncbi:MAG: neutral/alkaline non-lysosomal ceramidase N-terminal domain-containing protein [Elusimicrobia bacterium]|nr:neutral/alkaline non-lysosomal ceramidase N-terminal domain-containing protein [Elusimicrobiota bacterium]
MIPLSASLSVFWLTAVLGVAPRSAFAAGDSPGRGGAKLYAAAGKVDITPDLERETIWLAGYGAAGRRARGIHDPLYARALVVSDGRKSVALVGVDSIGLFREDVLAIRRAIGWDEGSGYVFIAATHDHSAPDTLGLWGRFPGVSGVDRRYRRRMLDSIAHLVKDLTESLQEAELEAAGGPIDPAGLSRDARDPVVIDPELQTARFLRRDPAAGRARAVLHSRSPWRHNGARGRARVIATLVRWSCHSEVLGRDNLLVTADYPGELCREIEGRTGGACLFLNGAIGGLLTPDVDELGAGAKGFEEAKRIGQAVARRALAMLHHDGARVNGGPVRFDSRVVRVPVENSRYLLFLNSLVFGHRLLTEDGVPLPFWKRWWLPIRHLAVFPLPASLHPWVETEVSRVRFGPVDILGVPGELFPELAIGGYDGRYRFGHPLVRPTNSQPPDLSRAPRSPYLRERMRSKYGMVVGLANDELGYIIPSYDFIATPTRSMLPKPKGHHYEETNSIGPSATAILLKAYEELLKR